MVLLGDPLLYNHSFAYPPQPQPKAQTVNHQRPDRQAFSPLPHNLPQDIKPD